jgi:hypothetical protein
MVIFRSDLDVVVPPSDIQGGKECLALELFKYVGDLGYGINIPDCPFVDLTIVLYQSKRAVLLFDKEEGGHIGRVCGFNITHGLVLIQELLCCLYLSSGEQVDLTLNYVWCLWLQFDRVILWL